MSVKVEKGKIIFRQWDNIVGLQETEVPFRSVEDLFELCLEVSDPRMVERVVIEGEDDRGKPHVITFVFQSLTITPGS